MNIITQSFARPHRTTIHYSNGDRETFTHEGAIDAAVSRAELKKLFFLANVPLMRDVMQCTPKHRHLFTDLEQSPKTPS